MEPNQLGIVSAFLASVTWAFGSSAYAKLAERYSAAVINTTRACVALVCFVLAIVFVDPEGSRQAFARLTSTHFTWLFLSMISSYAFGDLLFLASARRIGVPLALTLASVYPLWSALAGFLLRGEVLRPLQVLGLLLTIFGVAMVVLAGRREKTGKEGATKWGYICAILTSFLWAVNTVAVARGGEGLSTLVTGGLRMAIALILCPIVGLLLKQNMKPPLLRSADFRRYGGLFLFEAFGGTVFFVYGFAHASLAVAGALSSLAPVLSVPVAYFVFKEPVGWRRVVAIVGVTVGVVLLLMR